MSIKKGIILIYIHINSIFFIFSILNLQVNAETKILAKNGDTLLKLSKEYRIPLKELMYKNNINDANRIIEGEIIIMPLQSKNNINKKNLTTYTVIEGDTLYKIAITYNINPKDIASINNLDDASILRPNQIIILPKEVIYKKAINQENIKLASKNVFYHQTSKGENISDIARIHKIPSENIISLNKLNDSTNINPNTKLNIRTNDSQKWLKYGSLRINWADWRYLKGNYITQAKNKKNRSFYLAISCETRVLNNTLKNHYWTNWYFPKNDFEFKLINDFCDQEFKI